MRRFELYPSYFITFLVLLLVLESSTSSSVHNIWRKRNTLPERDLLGDWYNVMKNNFIQNERENELGEERENMERGYAEELGFGSKAPPMRFQKRGEIFFKSPDKSNFYSVPNDFRKGIPSIPMIQRGKAPSLSISDNFDVLRNQLRKQVNLIIRGQTILENKNLLKTLGRRRRR